MADVHTCVVVTNAVAVNLRELSRRLDKGSLTGMFTAKLSASGNLPATHWISSGYIRDAYLNAMTNPTRLFNVAKKAWADDGDTFPFTQNQINNALAACTVSDGTRQTGVDAEGVPILVEEGPHALLQRLGLKLIQEPM